MCPVCACFVLCEWVLLLLPSIGSYCTLTLGLPLFSCQSAKFSWNARLSTHLRNLFTVRTTLTHIHIYYCRAHNIHPKISLITCDLYFVNEYRNLLLFFLYYSCSNNLYLQYTPTHKNYLFLSLTFSLSPFVICFDPSLVEFLSTIQLFKYFAKW